MKHPSTTIPVIVLSAFLLGMVPFTRTITEFLRSANLLRGCLTALFFLCVTWTTWMGQTQWKRLSAGRRLTFWILAVGYALIIYVVGVMPEERMHFIQVSALSALYWLTLRREGIPAVRAAGFAPIGAAALGILEEILQRGVPGRVFDLRDIGMISSGALFSGLLLFILSDERV